MGGRKTDPRSQSGCWQRFRGRDRKQREARGEKKGMEGVRETTAETKGGRKTKDMQQRTTDGKKTPDTSLLSVCRDDV